MKKIVPSYKIGLVPEKYTTDKNNPFNIFVKVSGAGTVTKAKFMAYSDLNVVLAAYEEGKQKNDYKYDANQFFFDIPTDGLKERPGFEKFLIPALKYEFGPEHHIARLRAKALSTGDHVINFVFSYSPDDINWYSDRLEFKFHVNTFTDKYGWLVIIIAGITFILNEAFNLIKFLPQLFQSLIITPEEICNFIKPFICK